MNQSYIHTLLQRDDKRIHLDVRETPFQGIILYCFKHSNESIFLFFQVVGVVGFTPVEEVEQISVVPREGEEKEVRDFFREE